MVGNQSRELLGHTSSPMAYCEIRWTNTIHGPLGITYHPNKKVNMIADCSENHFTSHDLCDENHE
jgi:hypothetical protein